MSAAELKRLRVARSDRPKDAFVRAKQSSTRFWAGTGANRGGPVRRQVVQEEVDLPAVGPASRNDRAKFMPRLKKVETTLLRSAAGAGPESVLGGGIGLLGSPLFSYTGFYRRLAVEPGPALGRPDRHVLDGDLRLWTRPPGRFKLLEPVDGARAGSSAEGARSGSLARGRG